MSPLYNYSYPPQLTKDDVRRIQAMYGVKVIKQKEVELETNEIMQIVSHTVYLLLRSIEILLSGLD